MKIIIYISNWNAIGGVETFVKNFSKRMSKHYDVTLMFDNCSSQKIIDEMLQYCKVEKFNFSKTYDCDIFISGSGWGRSAFDKINAKSYIQMIHADYRVIISGWAFKYQKHPKTTHHVCVGEIVKEAFEQVTPHKCDAIIHNLLDNTIIHEPKRENDILHLVTCSRLSGEKGFKRMLQLAQQLDEKHIPYIWNVYGDASSAYAQGLIKSFANCPNVVFKGITLEPFKEINKADYLVQLSDTEGFAYSVYEAMQVKTPCIITPFASGNEQITHGLNGFIVPFDMNNIDFDAILRKDLKVPDFKELANEQHWINFFNFVETQYRKNMVKVRVISVVKGFKVGQEVDLSKERAELGVKNGLCEIIDSYEDSEEGTKGIVTRKTPKQADKEIKELNRKFKSK